ncbi:sugar phosphate isomerase/epimerase family protein [Sandaracinobacteroides sayramensis]|uniref:sugar phosphate isomerase/epimerase family protein n=1 Tax=Sandaracinobacteroides sayramensis TaxID=2913411 RepID=UPI001EDB45CE|nr:sugar phosphate isomerase/epimerase [Sandaracinobacteroides sayramensis]
MMRELLAADFDKGLADIAGTGITSVEFAGYFGRSAARIRSALAANGLRGVGAHCLRPDMAEAEVAEAIAFCAEAGLPYAIAPLPLIPALKLPITSREEAQAAVLKLTASDFQRSADIFNRFAEQAKQAGVRFAYHTHGLDFLPFGDRHAFDIMVERTDPALVDFELDLGNSISAGVDPIPLLERLKGRVPLAHAKDWQPGYAPSPVDIPASAPIGRGSIDWARLLAALRNTGVADLLIEQEQAPKAELLEILRDSRIYLEGVARR